MKALKILGVIILIIVAMVLVIPLFMSNDITVNQSVMVKASEVTVFRQVNKLSNWLNWSPFEGDTTMVNTYDGPDRGVGSKRSWTSKASGDGSMAIIESKPYKSIKNRLTFGSDGGGEGNWTFENKGDSILVNWSIQLKELKYPFQILMGPSIKSMLGPTLKSGLEALKIYCEKQDYPPEIEIINTDKIISLSIYDSAKVADIGKMLEKNYGKLMMYVQKKHYNISGAPFAVYHNWNPEGFTKISASIPVFGKLKEKGDIKILEIPAGKAVFLKHFGGYDTGNSHWAIEDYLKDFNLKTADFIWEEYITDPSTEPDSTKWQTNIYYPLK